MAKFFRVINRRTGWVTYARADNLRHARRKQAVVYCTPYALTHDEDDIKEALIKFDKDWIVDNGKKEIKRCRSGKEKNWLYYTR